MEVIRDNKMKMNFWEADITATQEQINKFDKQSLYTLESHKLFFEKNIEEKKKQIEALGQGRPFIDGKAMCPYFFRAVGFMDYDQERLTVQRGKALSGEMSPLALKEKGRAMGLPEGNACDKCYKLIAAVEAGTAQLEPLIGCENQHCPIRAIQKIFIATKWGVQNIFHFNIPYSRTEAALEYVVDQLREFIEIAEKLFPGVIKYDEDKLIEAQDGLEAVKGYNYEIYEMLKRQPSPISGWDLVVGRDRIVNNPECVRARRDEIAERVAKGFAAVPGEKLRVGWVERINFFDAFGALAKYQIASPLVYEGPIMEMVPWWPRPAYYGGRKLTPLEEVAALTLERSFHGFADVFVDTLIRACRELRIDGVVLIEQIGCSPLLGHKRIAVERVERELGIPIVVIEASESDSGYVGESEITAQLDDFAEMLLSQKGLS